MAQLLTTQHFGGHRQTSKYKDVDLTNRPSLEERPHFHPISHLSGGTRPLSVSNTIHQLHLSQNDDNRPVDRFVTEDTKFLVYSEDLNQECPASRKTVSDTKIKVHSETLERLMDVKQPSDVTGEVNLGGCLPIIFGGYAAVYRAKWKDIPVAVKVLNPRQQRRDAVNWKATMTRRCKREISVMAAVSHRNIVRFCGFVTDISEFPAIISEWCEHGSSADYLQKNKGRIPEEKRLLLAQDVVHGLAYLHSLGVVHGDLKPGNVLVDSNEVAKICDFGLVRLVEWQGASGMTTTSPYGGTILYKAYELFKTRGKAHPLPSFASDIYALGCVIHEFLYFAPPFQHLESGLDVLFEALKEGKPPAQRPTSAESEADSLLWDLIEACWKVDPLRRPSAEDAVFRLNRIRAIRDQTTNNSITSSPSISGKSRSAHQVGVRDTIGRSASSQLGSTDGSTSVATAIPQKIRDQEYAHGNAISPIFSVISHVYRLFRALSSAILQLVSSKL